MFENAIKLEDLVNDIILKSKPIETEGNQLDNVS
jgi:hypothetical protein